MHTTEALSLGKVVKVCHPFICQMLFLTLPCLVGPYFGDQKVWKGKNGLGEQCLCLKSLFLLWRKIDIVLFTT